MKEIKNTKGLKSEELCNLQELRDAGAIALTDDGRPVVMLSVTK